MGAQLWSTLIGMRCAYYQNIHNIELETESFDAVREWDDWCWHHDPNNERLIQQLEQRKKDKRLNLKVNVISETQNAMARFLATDGAQNRNRLVVFKRPFGRISELWHLDLGLGRLDDDFGLIDEEDYLQQQQHEIEDEIQGLAELLVHEQDVEDEPVAQ